MVGVAVAKAAKAVAKALTGPRLYRATGKVEGKAEKRFREAKNWQSGAEPARKEDRRIEGTAVDAVSVAAVVKVAYRVAGLAREPFRVVGAASVVSP